MSIPIYPVGLQLARITGTLAFGSGTLSVESERKFGYTGTDWVMPRFFDQSYTSRSIRLDLPFSDAPGRLGDNGAPLSALIGYRLEFRPDADSSVQGPGIVSLLLADGSPRNLWLMTGLGGWPNQTLIINPQPDPGGDGVVYVTDPGNPLRGYATTDGTH